MRANYDAKTDTLTFVLKDGVEVVDSDEEKPGIILDYDQNGDLVSPEILDASRRVTEARKMDFRVA